MRQYETIFVCRTDLPEEKISELTEAVKSIILQSNGEINSVDNWGKRRLAYKIAGHREGIYIYIDFTADGNVVEKIEKFYGVTEGILRYLTVKKLIKKTKSKKPVETMVKPEMEKHENDTKNSITKS